MGNIFLSLSLLFCLLMGNCQSVAVDVNQNAESGQIENEKLIKICVQPAPDAHTQTINTENLPRIEKFQVQDSGDLWISTGLISKSIYHSQDGGKDWEKLQIKDAERFTTFDFLDDKNGWLADDDGNIWRTTNSGEVWKKIYSFENLIKQRNFLTIEDVEFTTPQNGWLRETFNLYQTEDGGVSWKAVKQISSQPQKMFFSGENGWVSFGQDSQTSPLQIIKTSNGGKNWTESIVGGNNRAEAIFFLGEDLGWLSTSANQLFATKDGGENWTKVDLKEKNFQAKSIYWLNSQEGWLAGTILDPDKPVFFASSPTLLSTTDSGKTWNKFKAQDEDRFFNQVYFKDSSNGWLTSRSKIYRTIDGGKNWKSVLKVDLSCN